MLSRVVPGGRGRRGPRRGAAARRRERGRDHGRARRSTGSTPEPALRELGRVLRPAARSRSCGTCASWPTRCRRGSRRCSPRFAPARRRSTSSRGAPHVDASPLFGPAEERSFPWETAYTRAELAERLASVSFVARSPRTSGRGCSSASRRRSRASPSRCRSATARTRSSSRAPDRPLVESCEVVTELSQTRAVFVASVGGAGAVVPSQLRGGVRGGSQRAASPLTAGRGGAAVAQPAGPTGRRPCPSRRGSTAEISAATRSSSAPSSQPSARARRRGSPS